MKREAEVVARPKESRGVWWLNPAIAFSGPAVIAGFVAYDTDPAGYLYFWRTAKHFDLSSYELLIAVAIVFSCGCLFGTARRNKGGRIDSSDWTSDVRWEAVRALFRLSFILTIVAYIIWFAYSIKNGLTLNAVVEIMQGAKDTSYITLRKEYLITIPGVTTGTQFGLAVIALGVPLGVTAGWRSVRWQIAIVFALAMVRAFLNSERLAVIELLVPFVVSWIWLRPQTTRLVRFLTLSAPVTAAALLYVFFGAAEYFRSWSSFYKGRGLSFWSFIGLRLMGYYATALNNGALIWKVNEPLTLQLSPTALGLIWRFPILKDALPVVFPSLLRYTGGRPDLKYLDLLATSANMEFNNPSGIFSPIGDFGVAGGLLYWLVCGLICGYLYKESKLRSVAGVFLYPALYISLIEATRVLYWADGRFFPGMFILVVGVLFLFRKSHKLVAHISPLLPAQTMSR